MFLRSKCDAGTVREGEMGNTDGGQTAFEKVGRKLRFPDDFYQSQTEIHKFRLALAKVVRQFEKSAGIPKSRTEF